MWEPLCNWEDSWLVSVKWFVTLSFGFFHGSQAEHRPNRAGNEAGIIPGVGTSDEPSDVFEFRIFCFVAHVIISQRSRHLFYAQKRTVGIDEENTLLYISMPRVNA